MVRGLDYDVTSWRASDLVLSKSQKTLAFLEVFNCGLEKMDGIPTDLRILRRLFEVTRIHVL